MPLLRQYLATLADSRGLTRTLGEIELCRDAQGRPLVSVGNSAAVFRIRHAGRICALRCYLRPPRHLREIYGTRLLEGELYLYETPTHGVWTDVVLDDWIEGETLDRVVRRAAQAGERARLHDLAAAFDRLAAELLADERAHGDLKPENIVVGTDGGLHPIDFDAAYLPAFAGERSPELGTAAYQHPARTAELYDERLDDYPAALISTALHALACDPSLLLRHGDADGLLLTPQAIPEDAAYREITALFRHRGMALPLRIAELLASPTPHLCGAAALFALAAGAGSGNMTAPDTDTDGEEVPELFVEQGRWGYRTPRRIVIPALYDCGFDFTEGLAAVLLGDVWHYIDTAGRTVISCPGCEAVKPFRGGRAQIVRDGRRRQINRTGTEFDI